MIMYTRFYVSCWLLVEAHSAGRPPQAIVSVIAKTLRAAQDAVQRSPVCRDFQVFDTVEAAHELDEAVTLSQLEESRYLLS